MITTPPFIAHKATILQQLGLLDDSDPDRDGELR